VLHLHPSGQLFRYDWRPRAPEYEMDCRPIPAKFSYDPRNRHPIHFRICFYSISLRNNEIVVLGPGNLLAIAVEEDGLGG
jgi:hypothetical protein